MKKHKNNSSKTVAGTKTCFVCRTTAPREEMLRFVGHSGDVIRFDFHEKLPGRGMWLHANRDCLKKAIDQKLFYKAAKGTVIIPKDFIDAVEKELQYNPIKHKLFLKGAIHE